MNSKTLEEIPLTPAERLAIHKAVDALRQNLPIAEIILFGSKARGDSDEESDVDLLLLTKGRLKDEEESRMTRLLSDIEMENFVFFGLVHIPEEVWYHGIYQVMPLRHEVDRDGIVL
jgi:uncharacterized protein